MSKLTRSIIKNFLIERQGYLKKSPKLVAEAIWHSQSHPTHLSTYDEINKDLNLIKSVQRDLRSAKNYTCSKEQEDLMDAYNKIMSSKNRSRKRIFFDIEVSPNVVLSWSIGNKISLSHDNIIQERAIICICYKWEGESTVHSLEWKKGCDKEMLSKFSKIIDLADEVIGQNSDSFDIKWLRTRCLFHRIPLTPKFNSLDTLKFARNGFRFNSNKLDYMGKFLGFGGKIKTDYDLWKDIVLNNDQTAMTKMIKYCKEDVVLLEKVYRELQDYSPIKKFKYRP